MGQIVFNGQKPKYCKLQAIRLGGNHVNDNVALNEVWLVDTSSSSQKSELGTGEYNAYIIGDGVKKAGQLPLHYITPRTLAELEGDTTHRTVTDEDIANWNRGTGGDGDIINNPDNEDIASVEVSGVNVLKFKDKAFDATSYSGYGKKILRKNIVSEKENINQDVDIPVLLYDPNEENHTINDAIDILDEATSPTAVKVDRAYWDLNAGVGGKAVLHDQGGSYFSIGYIISEVSVGEKYNIAANFVSNVYAGTPGYFWAVIDNTSSKTILQCDNTTYSENQSINATVNIENNGYLIINLVIYNSPVYNIIKQIEGETSTYNIVSSLDFTSPNTQYVIQYDYDLNSREVVLGENSVLVFQGGSINNGVLRGNNTFVIADENSAIFGKDLALQGSWKNKVWYAAWFSPYADGESDDTKILQKMLDITSTTTVSKAYLNWYGYTFRTSKGLFLKDNTEIYGGTIIANFENPLDWVLQTYAIVAAAGRVTSYNVNEAWAAFNNGSIKHVTGCFIKDLTIRGELHDNGDDTWSPVFGGLRLQATDCPTDHVSIYNVGYGICRACTVVSWDRDLISYSKFCSYAAQYVISVSVDTAYFQTNAHYQSSGSGDTTPVIPFTEAYQGPIFRVGSTYIDGNGGLTDDDEQPRPKFAVFRGHDASMSFTNVAMDNWQEVAFACGLYCRLYLNLVRFEAVVECLIFSQGYSNITVVSPVLDSNPTYDIYCGNYSNSVINLIGASEINCNGYGDSSKTKRKFNYEYRYGEPTINVFGERTQDYPDLPFFHFIGENDTPINIVPDGYEAKYTNPHSGWTNGGNGKYLIQSQITRTSRSKFVVKENTTVTWPSGLNYSLRESRNYIFTGENKNTSVISMPNSLAISSEYKHYISVTFENLTIKFTDLGGLSIAKGHSITFVNCNIIVLSAAITQNNSSLSTEIGANVSFIDCSIYAKKADIFRGGHIKLINCVSSPIIRYGYDSSANKTNVSRFSIDLPQQGTTQIKNSISYHTAIGHSFYDASKSRSEMWNGKRWVSQNGYPYILESGTSENTPAIPDMKIGSRYNNTTLSLVKELTANGTCGYGTFVFNAVFPKVDRNFFIGATEVTVTNGEYSVNLPAGTYPICCSGYDCYPSTVTISANSTLAIYQKASKYSTTYKIQITAKNDNDEVVTDLNIIVGGYTATVPSGKNYYEVNLPRGDYQIMAEGYSDQTPLKVNGFDDSITAVFANETSSQTVVLDGSVYNHDIICDSNDTSIAAGKYTVTVDSTSLEVSITNIDLDTILYFNDDAITDVNKQLAYLLIKKWFEAGHYGEYINNVGARLYSDTVGTATGNDATFTDTSTNLPCTVTHNAGTNATWVDVESSSGGGSSIMEVITASGTSLTAAGSKYYRYDSDVNTLAVTLPNITDNSSLQAVVLCFTTGSTPNITFTAGNKSIMYFDNYEIESNKTYEVNCMYNGLKWIIGASQIVAQS